MIVFNKMPYDLLRDFTPISMVGTSPLMLFANGGPYKNGDIKGYYHSDMALVSKAMRPSGTFNAALAGLK